MFSAKIEGFAPAANCSTAPTAAQSVTLYAGPIEVRDWKNASTEAIYAYPLPNIRLVYDATATYATALHRDALGTVRGVTQFTTDTAKQGKMAERSVFRPYGEAISYDAAPDVASESKGYIGERYDGDAGLQYLNARYYDPKLGMFIQPDWWEVTKAGVGTNRYSYSFGDPVNRMDPTGHYSWKEFKSDVGSFFSGAASGAAKQADFDKTVKLGTSGALGGAAYGGALGTGAGCAATACAASVVTGPSGAAGGFVTGGLLGGSLGIVYDSSEVMGGGIFGGYQAVVDAQDERSRQATKTIAGSTTSDQALVHGNSKASKKQNEMYHLKSTVDGRIRKIGVTSAAPGRARHPNAFYASEQVEYFTQATYPTRIQALAAEFNELVRYHMAYGELPDLNKVFR